MYAVIETGGKQYKVIEGEKLQVEKLGIEPGKHVFDKVLLVGNENDLKIGKPYITGVSVEAELARDLKAKKIIVFKKKKRKGYQKRFGHRQTYSEVVIKKINAN